jgi:hypothetical protein
LLAVSRDTAAKKAQWRFPEHDAERACPGLDPEWICEKKGHAQQFQIECRSGA